MSRSQTSAASDRRFVATSRGFTLIELMIVVAIVGILASIAIPNFLRFQLKSKTAEVKVNLHAIRTAQGSVFAEFGSYIAANPSPATIPGVVPVVFSDSGTPGANFQTLGWAPEGRIFFRYAVATSPGYVGAFTADAVADIDGSGTVQTWGYIHRDANGNEFGGTQGCSEVFNTPAGGSYETVGPCDLVSGTTEF